MSQWGNIVQNNVSSVKTVTLCNQWQRHMCPSIVVPVPEIVVPISKLFDIVYEEPPRLGTEVVLCFTIKEGCIK